MRAIEAVLLGASMPFLLAAAGDPELLVIDAGTGLYPAAALEQKLQGDVPITLKISETGELRCSVAPNATLAALRRPSCALVAARNIFEPPVRDGKPAAQEYSFVVRWNPGRDDSQFGGAIPIGRARWITFADYPATAGHHMMTGRIELSFDITAFGRTQNCTITRTGTTNALAGEMCPLILKRAMFLPALGADGRPKATKGTLKLDWKWCEATGEARRRCPGPDTGA